MLNVHLCAKGGPIVSIKFVQGQENQFSAIQRDFALDRALAALESPENEIS